MTLSPEVETSPTESEPVSSPESGGGGAPGLNSQGHLIILDDGSKHYFPEGTSESQIRKTLKLPPPGQLGQMNPGGGGKSVLDPGRGENWVDKVRPYVAGGVGATAAGLTSLIPGVGESGVAQIAADTQGYALVDSLMKYLGANPPKSYSEALTDSEKDAAVNAVAGKLIGGVFKGVKSAFNYAQPKFYDFAPTFSQGLEKFGMKVLATIPKFIEDYGIPASKAAALDRAGGKGFTQALAHANSINGRMAGTNSNPNKLFDAIKGQLQLGLDDIENPIQGASGRSTLHKVSQEALDLLETAGDHFDKLRDVISKPNELAKVLKVGSLTGSPALNVKRDLAAFNFMDMINKATTKDLKGTIRFDPKILTKAFNNKDMQTSLELLHGKTGLAQIGEFFQNIAATQTEGGANPVLGKYLRYGSTAGKFILGMGVMKDLLTAGTLGTTSAIATGLQIGASTIGRAFTNPFSARILTEMARGTFKENPSVYAKVLGNILRNQTVGLISADGSVKNGVIEEDQQTGMLKFQQDQ